LALVNCHQISRFRDLFVAIYPGINNPDNEVELFGWVANQFPHLEGIGGCGLPEKLGKPQPSEIQCLLYSSDVVLRLFHEL
jgi:hypothetical protein